MHGLSHGWAKTQGECGDKQKVIPISKAAVGETSVSGAARASLSFLVEVDAPYRLFAVVGLVVIFGERAQHEAAVDG